MRARTTFLRTTLAAFNDAKSTISVPFAATNANSEVRTSAVTRPMRERKPNVGTRFCSGSWPPSKPGRTLPPDRAFWPLWPRPQVLPPPAAMPRPTRFFVFVLPSAGPREFNRSSMLVAIHFKQIPYLGDHSAHRWRVFQLAA